MPTMNTMSMMSICPQRTTNTVSRPTKRDPTKIADATRESHDDDDDPTARRSLDVKTAASATSPRRLGPVKSGDDGGSSSSSGRHVLGSSSENYLVIDLFTRLLRNFFRADGESDVECRTLDRDLLCRTLVHAGLLTSSSMS